jgi:hypothetical protein
MPLLATAVLAVAVLSAAVVVVVARGGEPSVTPEAFLDEVHAVCTEYGERLDEIAPPVDLSSPGAVYESLGAALPLLREQAAAVRSLETPPSLRSDLEEFFVLTDRSLVELKDAYDAAGERALYPMAVSLSRFEKVRDDAKRVARQIGFDC